MNENLNIAKILKAVGAKEGYPLYSTVVGDVKLVSIHEGYDLIIVKGRSGVRDTYTEKGQLRNTGECLLFPSKDNRDWSTVKPECPFKPYDRVLVRDGDEGEWKCDFFSHYNKDAAVYQYRTAGNAYTYCIPYEGNEHLVGTTDYPKRSN